MIKGEYIGKNIKITTSDGCEYTGKAVELQGSEETESGEPEIGINYAGGITMFEESIIESIEVVTLN
jgi:hypothetical protein